MKIALATSLCSTALFSPSVLLNHFKSISNRLRNNHHLKPKIILDEHELAMANE